MFIKWEEKHVQLSSHVESVHTYYFLIFLVAKLVFKIALSKYVYCTHEVKT